MIARQWRGWTSLKNADAYEAVLRTHTLPEIEKIEGHCACYLLRKDGPAEVEFIVLNFFDSIEAVKRYAGPDYSVAVFHPEGLALLSRVEPNATHYEVRYSPERDS